MFQLSDLRGGGGSVLWGCTTPDLISFIWKAWKVTDLFPCMASCPAHTFAFTLLQVVDNPASHVKPANVDEIRWRQVLSQAGGPNNADK